MIIGVPKETHRHEHRVGLTPYAVRWLRTGGHTVVVERDAGTAARFSDREYEEAGAQIVYSSEEAYKRADVVCRVGLLAPDELELLKSGTTVCGFHHLSVAARPTLERLVALETTMISYELIEDRLGNRPLLVPLSEMAGQMAVYAAAHHLENRAGGRGILLGAVPGVAPPTVLIVGAGTVGRTAARRAVAIGAHVIVLDEDLEKLRSLSAELAGQVVTQIATPDRLAQYTAIADVVIGAILIPGARAPLLITEEMVRNMRGGSVIVDVSIDQGGCVETSRPTDPDRPTFVVHDVVHYCVPNMTASVARTASRALSDAVRTHLRPLFEQGLLAALRAAPGLAAGVCLYRGAPIHGYLAAALGVEPRSLSDAVTGGSDR